MIDQLKQNKVLLALAVLLIGYGLVKPNLNNLFPSPNNNVIVVDDSNIKAPTDKALLEACDTVTECLRNGSGSRKTDATRLSSLYRDLATLIKLDGEDQVIKSTIEIREANKIAGSLCRLNFGGKYPGLVEACNNLVIVGLGDDDVVLDEGSRQKAVDTFMALSWACSQGSK
jgi:hypothetical protein